MGMSVSDARPATFRLGNGDAIMINNQRHFGIGVPG